MLSKLRLSYNKCFASCIPCLQYQLTNHSYDQATKCMRNWRELEPFNKFKTLCANIDQLYYFHVPWHSLIHKTYENTSHQSDNVLLVLKNPINEKECCFLPTETGEHRNRSTGERRTV